MTELVDTLPQEVAYRILVNGDSGVGLLREWRGMTVNELAFASGLKPQQIIAVESDPRDLDDAMVEKLAQGLRVTTALVVAVYEEDDSSEIGAPWPANDL